MKRNKWPSNNYPQTHNDLWQFARPQQHQSARDPHDQRIDRESDHQSYSDQKRKAKNGTNDSYRQYEEPQTYFIHRSQVNPKKRVPSSQQTILHPASYEKGPFNFTTKNLIDDPRARAKRHTNIDSTRAQKQDYAYDEHTFKRNVPFNKSTFIRNDQFANNLRSRNTTAADGFHCKERYYEFDTHTSRQKQQAGNRGANDQKEQSRAKGYHGHSDMWSTQLPLSSSSKSLRHESFLHFSGNQTQRKNNNNKLYHQSDQSWQQNQFRNSGKLNNTGSDQDSLKKEKSSISQRQDRPDAVSSSNFHWEKGCPVFIDPRVQVSGETQQSDSKQKQGIDSDQNSEHQDQLLTHDQDLQGNTSLHSRSQSPQKYAEAGFSGPCQQFKARQSTERNVNDQYRIPSERIAESSNAHYLRDQDQTALQLKEQIIMQRQQYQKKRDSADICQPSTSVTKPKACKTYRRKQPSLKPDQPLPNPPEEGTASGMQHAFRSSGELQGDTGFDFCQTSQQIAAMPRESHNMTSSQNTEASIQPLMASAGRCKLRADELVGTFVQPPRLAVLCGDDSDNCDFNEIDNEIQDTLMRRSVSSDEEPVVLASQRSTDRPSENEPMVQQDPVALVPPSGVIGQNVETTSTSDSAQDVLSAETSPSKGAADTLWCVTLPSESVLLFDSLQDFMNNFGKVLAVQDVNENIQAQYEDKESAQELQKALEEMQISAQVSQLSLPTGCQSIQKTLFSVNDAELTLKLLKITPPVNELNVKRTDSEFMKDYNSTAKQPPAHSQAIISTEGSEDTLAAERPSLDQAYKMLAKDQVQSEMRFLFAPNMKTASYAHNNNSHVALSSHRQFDHQQTLLDSATMQSTVFSADNGPLAREEVSLIDGTSEYGPSIMQSYRSNDVQSFFEQSFPQQTSGKQSNFVSATANQIQYESVEDFANQQSEVKESVKFAQCFPNGPNDLPSNMKHPFGTDPIRQDKLAQPSMILPTGTTFYPTPAASSLSGSSSQAQPQHHKLPDPQFRVNLDRILRGEDSRTTVMIRHIPNKYTEDMLLQRINRNHHGTFDFFYLPLDLNNGCNIGYAFINFVDPVFIVPFYQDLDNQSWETFNSEKICQITYGRIQGKRNLVENVNKQPETRKIKPLILNVPHNVAYIENLRSELYQSRQGSALGCTMTANAPEFNRQALFGCSRRGQQQQRSGTSSGPQGKLFH